MAIRDLSADEIQADIWPILQGAIDAFGESAQVDILIEEMSELTKALIKARRSKKPYNTREVMEELADVTICLCQLEIILDMHWDKGNHIADSGAALEAIINNKVKRLDERITKATKRLGALR